MPLYQQIILTVPKAKTAELSNLFKKYCKIVINGKGLVRGIENHGIRSLPEQAKRKYPTLDGSRYFWEARFLTCTIDASPKCLEDIDRFIKTDGCVLRYFTIKTKATVDLVTNPSFRNPYLEPPIQKVKPF